MKKSVMVSLVIISICTALEAFAHKSSVLWFIYYSLETYTLAYFTYFISKEMRSKYKAILYFIMGILSYITYIVTRTALFSIKVKGFFIGILQNEIKYAFPISVGLSVISFFCAIFIIKQMDRYILKSEENYDDLPD